ELRPSGSRCGNAMRNKVLSIAALVLAAGLALSLTDLYKVQQGTLVVYTTPALRDLLESLVVPRFHAATGTDVTLVYVSAGEEYNRLRMSGGHPEADLFLHASPLYLEKGFAEGYFLPFQIGRNASVPPNFVSRSVAGGHLWYAFAWSPLAQVYDPQLGATPALASLDTTFGSPHPLLSNNRIYAVLFFENVAARARLCAPGARDGRPPPRQAPVADPGVRSAEVHRRGTTAVLGRGGFACAGLSGGLRSSDPSGPSPSGFCSACLCSARWRPS